MTDPAHARAVTAAPGAGRVRGRPKARLHRDQVLAAAIAILDAEGPEALTYRRLAARLDTGVGTLYWHVENKDALLALVLDVILGEMGDPFTGRGEDSWPGRLRAGFVALWTVLRRHPWAAQQAVISARSPAMLRFWDGGAELLFAAGLDPENVTYALSTLRTYVIGNGMQNAVWHVYGRGDQSPAVAAIVFDDLPPDSYPAFLRVVPVLARHDERTQFLRGLDLILAGLTG